MYSTFDGKIKHFAIAAAICEALHVIFIYVVEFTGYHIRLEFIFEGSDIINIILRLVPLVLLLIYIFKDGSTKLFAASVLAAGTCIAAQCFGHIYHDYQYSIKHDSSLEISKYTVYHLLLAFIVIFAGICLFANYVKKTTVVYPLAIALIGNAFTFIKECYYDLKYFSLYYARELLYRDLNEIAEDILPYLTHILTYACMIFIMREIMPLLETPTSSSSAQDVSPEEQLTYLNELLESGAITQEEYDSKRKETVDSL